jgi:hypothetical protein
LKLHELPDGNSEAPDGKTEHHNGYARAHPSKESALICKMVAGPIRALVGCERFVFWDFDGHISSRERRMTKSGELFYGRFKQRTDAGDVLHQFVGDLVTSLEIVRGIVRKPDLTLGVFPGQGF